MVPPSQPLGGTDAEGKGRKHGEAQKKVKKVKHRQLLRMCRKLVGENRVKGIWRKRGIRVKDA